MGVNQRSGRKDFPKQGPPLAPAHGLASTATHDPALADMSATQVEPDCLAANVMHFARLLRRAGLPVGPAEAIVAQRALTRIDLASKPEARTALRTAMIH